MTTCKSCRWSYSPDVIYGWTLRCNPGGRIEQNMIATRICDDYERCAGCDEPEEVGE